jgi:hypothetical protein
MMFCYETAIPLDSLVMSLVRFMRFKSYIEMVIAILSHHEILALFSRKINGYFYETVDETVNPLCCLVSSLIKRNQRINHERHILKVLENNLLLFLRCIQLELLGFKKEINTPVRSKRPVVSLSVSPIVSLNGLKKAIYHKPLSEIALFKSKFKIQGQNSLIL